VVLTLIYFYIITATAILPL